MSDQGWARGDLFERATSDMLTFFAGDAEGTAGHGASGATRTGERFALKHQTATDAGPDRHIEELLESLPGPEESLGQCCRAHIRFESDRSQMREPLVHGL